MSEQSKRIIVGIIAIPLILWIVYYGSYPLALLALTLQSLCIYELLQMFRRKLKVDIVITLILSAIAFLLFIYQRNLYFIFGVIIIIYFIIEVLLRKNYGLFFITIFSITYITMPFALLVELGKNYYYVFLLLILIWSNDIFAYFGGRLIGKHQLSKISPKKTIEGFIIGFIFTVLSGYLFHLITPDSILIYDGIILGVLIGFTAPIGDLFESFLKRYTGIKDSSNIIPGHGGVLDRFDSLIFSLPFIYIYFSYIKLLFLQ